jgi:putative membrane-bound dehydrogenase-like protein
MAPLATVVMALSSLVPAQAVDPAPVVGAAERPSQEVTAENVMFTLAGGLEIQRVAGPPLIERPISCARDEAGNLYVSEASGTNDPVDKQVVDRPHRIVRLRDTDGDGVFDQRTVFARDLMLPQGVMWLHGSLYVSSAPQIWKLTDADGDGVAEKRDVWHDGKTLTGCANDLHGPFAGPDGWIYWGKGAFAEQTYDLADQKGWKSTAAHIFRMRPDGTGIEPLMAAGMDNPVSVAFTENGQMFMVGTFVQHPGGGKRDGITHVSYGGVYGKDHEPIHPFPRTGDLMPPMTHLGSAAPSSLITLKSNALGHEWKGSLVVCQFNTNRISRHVLVPAGATYRTEDSQVLVAHDPDFHPTDVLEDEDGSLLVCDTGGWYKLCCPTSSLSKNDALGGIWRLKRTGAPAERVAAVVVPARPVELRADVAQITAGLQAASALDRRHAGELAGRLKLPVVPQLLQAAAAASDDRALFHSLTYALLQIGDAAQTRRGLAAGQSPSTIRAALYALEQMPGGNLQASEVVSLLGADDAGLRATALWVLGRHGEWGDQAADWFEERINAGPLPQGAESVLASLAGSGAVQRLLVTAAAAASGPTEIRRAALRAMSRARLQPTPAPFVQAMASLLGDDRFREEVMSSLQSLALTDEDHTILQPLLLKLATDEKSAAAVRLAAVTAAQPGLPSLPPEVAAFVVSRLAADVPFMERASAAAVLAHFGVSGDAARAAAGQVESLGAYELARLLPAFHHVEEPTIVRRVLSSLEASAALPAVNRDVLAALVASVPDGLQASAANVMAKHGATLAAQAGKLDTLAASLPDGDVVRGQQVFRSTKAGCIACHSVGYLGGDYGPDLSKVGAIRTTRDLLEAIVLPAATLVRSYEPSQVTKTSGEVVFGLLRNETSDELVVAVAPGQSVRVPRAEVARVEPVAFSPMPAGYDQTLTRQELADVITYLKSCQ